MMINHMELEAIETAITIENRSLCFYRAVLSKVSDSNARRVFELLLEEEKQHLNQLCDLYQGSKEKLDAILNKDSLCEDPFYCALSDSIDSDSLEIDALEVALREEQACVRNYSRFVETIREPSIHDMFSRILCETRNHCEMIEDEYMRLMHMVDRTDQETYVRE